MYSRHVHLRTRTTVLVSNYFDLTYALSTSSPVLCCRLHLPLAVSLLETCRPSPGIHRWFSPSRALRCHCNSPSSPLDNIWVMTTVWRLRGDIIKTTLCWIVWHNVHSLHHAYVSSSYRSNRLGLSHWDPYAVRRGSCLELYYCNMVE